MRSCAKAEFYGLEFSSFKVDSSKSVFFVVVLTPSPPLFFIYFISSIVNTTLSSFWWLLRDKNYPRRYQRFFKKPNLASLKGLGSHLVTIAINFIIATKLTVKITASAWLKLPWMVDRVNVKLFWKGYELDHVINAYLLDYFCIWRQLYGLIVEWDH